jgi:hypothetical protein
MGEVVRSAVDSLLGPEARHLPHRPKPRTSNSLVQQRSLFAAEAAREGDDCVSMRAGAVLVQVQDTAVPCDTEPSAKVTAEADPGRRSSGNP